METKKQTENQIKEDLKSNYNIIKEKSIRESLKKNRENHIGSKIKSLPFPHEIALENEMTNYEMEKFIIAAVDDDLRREWVLYKESMKISFAAIDPTSKKDLMGSYNLGMGQKSIPDINFVFNYKDDLAKQNLNLMLEQTEISKMKMEERLIAMGVINSKTDIKKIEDVFDEVE